MNRQQAAALIGKFNTKRILVVGEIILDEFIWGKVSRISPEAPVPVVEVDRESYYAGGAANVVRNLHELGSRSEIISLLGADLHAERLKALLLGYGVDLECLQQDPSYQTIVKTRIIARQQQVVRVDREKRISGFSPEQFTRALDVLDRLLPQLDAVIIEDYGKGILTQSFTDEIIARASRAGTIITVDPNPTNLLAWHSVTAITPNRSEAFAAAGVTPSDPVDPPQSDADLLRVGAILLAKWQPRNLLITLSEQGMMLFRPDAPPYHIPTRARDVFDVSGAGDTAIATFTLALCSGATAIEAAKISNHASGVVVGKLGTATVSREELLASFDE